MDTQLTLLVFLAIFVSFQYNVDARSPLKIVNGTDADEGEFPYMVQLRNSNSNFLCGGGIIGPTWIITAGHCVEAGIYSIIYGTNQLYDRFDGYPDTSIKVKQWYLHPNFKYDFGDIPSYDVGILELESPIPYNATVQPIQLPEANASVPFHEQGVLSGWGANKTWGDREPTLQKIYLPLLLDGECIEKINGYSDTDYFNPIHHLCSDDYYNGECFGDSGSPYVINSIVYGLVSWSIKPCGIVPGTYSRITNPTFRNWIKNVTNI